MKVLFKKIVYTRPASGSNGSQKKTYSVTEMVPIKPKNCFN